MENPLQVAVIRLRRTLESDRELESAAFALTLHPNAPAHQLYDPGAYRKTQSRAAVLARGRTIGLAEGIEDHLTFFGRDADTRVRHRKPDLQGSFGVRFNMGLHGHAPFVRE